MEVPHYQGLREGHRNDKEEEKRAQSSLLRNGKFPLQKPQHSSTMTRTESLPSDQ